MPKIAIVLGSTRPGRHGEAVAHWVLSQAEKRTDAEFELVDVADADLPLLDEPLPAGSGQYSKDHTKAWSERIKPFDGYVFVTGEYNHGVPGTFKNAFDFLFHEWSHKSVGFVSYGADGGVRAVEQWRTIVANAHLQAVRAQVSLSLFSDFGEDGFLPLDRRAGELDAVLEQVVFMAGTLEPARA